jgi:hypothetical protein
VADLVAEVEALATALGLMNRGTLVPAFFSDPLSHVRTILSNPDQRVALLTALDSVLPPSDDPHATADGETVTLHPIVSTSTGAVAIAITRSGLASSPTVVLGLHADAADAASGIAIEVDLPLVRAEGSALTVVAGAPTNPLAVGVRVPVGWHTPSQPFGLDSLSLSALVLAPPDLDHSRVVVELAGLDLGAGPTSLTLDPFDLGADFSHALAMLVVAGLRQSTAATDDAVKLLIDHLPGVLGLGDGVPSLPLGDLVHDVEAFRRWLVSLITTQVDGVNAFYRWLDQSAQLLGAPALPAFDGSLPTAARPLVVTLADGGATGATVELQIWLATPATGAVQELHVAADVHIAGDVARLAGRAELLVIPLGGSDPTRPLTSAEIVVESNAPLLPGPGGPLTVGRGRGGMRWDGSAVVPILELDDVHVELPGVVEHPTDFVRLDLTHAKTLAAEAKQVVGDFLTANLGVGTFATAIGTLLGFSVPPTPEQLGAFSNDPIRTIGRFHRDALAANAYQDVAQQIVGLFGVTSPVTGSGTADHPWTAPLTDVPVPDGSQLTIEVRVWDEPAGADHDLHIGLGLVVPPGAGRLTWSVGLVVDVLSFRLPADEPVRAGLLGAVRLEVVGSLPDLTGAAIEADEVRLLLAWRPGEPLTTHAAVTGVKVLVDGTAVAVGDLSVPDGLTPQLAEQAWPAVRTLLARAARSWGGGVGSALADLVGLSRSAPTLPSSWPLLDLPDGHLEQLLADLPTSLRARVAELVSSAVDPDGQVPTLAAVDLVRDILTHAALPPLGPPAVPAAPQVTGTGTYDDPWSVPITDAATPLVSQPVDLLAWMEPAPPKSWAAFARGLLDVDEPDLGAAISDLTGVLGEVADSVAGMSTDTVSRWLTSASQSLGGTDGMTSSDVADAVPPGMTVANTVPVAAHARAPKNPDVVTVTQAHLQANDAAGLPVLLLAPSFAPEDVWEEMLAGVDPADTAWIDLRVPGVDPAVVDLNQVTKARRYLVDLADEGSATLEQLQTRLHRVVVRVCELTASPKAALVGHSTAGVAAVSYAAAHPERCQACVTIAAPFVAGVPVVLGDPDAASGIRLVRTLLPAGLPLPALDAAVTDAAAALDGYTGVTPTAYPTAAFTRTLPAGTDVTAVPTLAVSTTLEAGLTAAVAAGLAAAHDGAQEAATPTHLAWGVRTHLDLGAEAALGVDMHARVDLGRVALADDAVEPAHPAHRFGVDALVYRPGGWLVGSAGTGEPLDVRLRSARLKFETSDSGASMVTTLYDGAVNGSGLPTMGFEDARSARLVGAFVDALTAAAEPGTSAQALVDVLTTLEIMSFDEATQHRAMRADAVAALGADPAGWLGPRMRTLLATQPALFGLVPEPPQAGTPRTWRRPVGDLPLELVVRTDPWSVGVRTTGDGLSLGDAAGVTLQALVPMAGPPTIEATICAAGVSLRYADAALTLAAPPLLSDLQVVPVSAGVAGQLIGALAPTGLAAAASAALEEALGGALPIGPLVGLLHAPSRWLADVSRFGTTAGGFDADAIAALLRTVGEATTLPVDDTGLTLAEGMRLVATSAEGGATRLGLTATGLELVPGGPALDLGLSIDIIPAPAGWTVRPAGTAGLTIPLSGGAWPHVGVQVGVDDSGFTLSVTPGTGAAVALLPHFAGLWDLVGGGVKALLPGVLDRLVQELSPADPDSVMANVLAVADGLGLRTGVPPSFDSTALATLVDDVTAGDRVPTPAGVAAVVSALMPAGSAVTVSGTAQQVVVSLDPLPVAGAATLKADLGPSGSAPTIRVELVGVGLGPMTGELRIHDGPGGFGFRATLQVDVPTDLGFDFTPALTVSAFPLSVALLPLGTETQPTLQLAPTPGIAPDRAALGGLLVAWAEPIAAKAALEAARGLLDQVLWTPASGTPLTAHALLRTVGLVVDDGAGAAQLVRSLPDAPTVMRGLLAGLGTLTIPVSPGLAVGLYSQGRTWLGIGLSGTVDIDAGDIVVSAVLGAPDIGSWSDIPPGLGLLLLDDAAGLTARPGVRLGGVGVRVKKKAGSLVDTDAVALGQVAALVQASIDLTSGSIGVSSLHGGVQITQIGLPLGGSSNPSNPIAASLLKPAGSPGDDKPASPPADLSVVSNSSGVLEVLINSKSAEQPFFIDIHKTFGPLHIDRVGLRHFIGGTGDAIGALVDGGVSIAGLTVDVQGLELDVPLKHPAELDLWDVDLAGLALSFSAGPVSIEGGLLKTSGDAGVEYDGQVKVAVGSFGLTAIAGYAQAIEQAGTYTSLFVFVVVDAPLGGPPFLFVTGLAGGAGYNRQLIVPTDPNLIPSYPLVRAMSEGVGTDPMGALHQMSKAMPPRRGSYWVAAGVKFTTFELINTKALAYVALDRSFEVGVMGLMTMALPTPDTALISIELSLLARYSTADQLLALRAQLTNNSWLVSKDCQLTGGFAFYSWFGDSPSVYFTIGGHGGLWDPDPRHPEPAVPPVGFHWAVMSGVVVKGEFYFALSPRQIAFGGRLEAAAEFGPIRVWFAVWLDVWLEWDPLHYHADAGITIGAAFHFTIDLLFTSITINISISIGGSITLEGPPLHGSVTVDLEIASVTVDFGSRSDQLGLSWPEFAAKFVGLLASPNADPTSSGEKSSIATVASGQLADSTKGPGKSGEAPDGTHGKPWKVLAEFGLAVACKMPVDTAVLGGMMAPAGGLPGGVEASPFDIKPMGSSGAPYAAHLEIQVKASTVAGWVDIDTSQVVLGAAYDHFPTAVWLHGNDQPPPEHRDMWRSLSGATMGFPVSTPEATGVLGEVSSIPISALVAEGDTVKPMPFTSPPQALRMPIVPSAGERLGTAAVESADTAPAPAASPQLVATVRRDGPTATSTHRAGTVAHAAFAAASRLNAEADTAVLVDTADAHVWAAPVGGIRFEGRGGGDVRVTTLSATGYLLDDREGQADQLSFDTHPHAARVVVTGLGTASADVQPAMGAVSLAPRDDTRPATGWQTGTMLTQVAGDTLLGIGCAVLVPRKVAAPQPATTERRVQAGQVMSRVSGVQTLLPRDVEVVVVLLDELDPAVSDDLVVTVGSGHEGGGRLGEADEVWAGSRRCLVYAVTEHPDLDRLVVSVASARAWRLAGIVGVHGDAAEWLGVLRGSPYPHLVSGPAEGRASAYVMSARAEVPA